MWNIIRVIINDDIVELYEFNINQPLGESCGTGSVNTGIFR